MGSSGRNQGCGLAAADEVYLTLHCRQLCGSERLPMVRLDRLGRPNRTVASTRLWPLWKAFHNAESLLPGGRGARPVLSEAKSPRGR